MRCIQVSYSLILSVFFVSFMTQEKKKNWRGRRRKKNFCWCSWLFIQLQNCTHKHILFFPRDLIHHLNLFKSAEKEMLIYLLDMIEIPSVSLSLSLWISHTLEASFVISSLRFFEVEQSKCRNYLDFFFSDFCYFFPVFVTFSSIFPWTTFFPGD